MVGAILKAHLHKEDDAAPLVSLWDSWFYRNWESDRAMIYPLVENWKHLCVGVNAVSSGHRSFF